MKTVYITIIGLFLYNISIAQSCIVEGEFYNSTDISTKGQVQISTNKKGHLIIKMDNTFKTEEGPDLDVYLSKSEKVTNENSVRINSLTYIDGKQRYAYNKPLDINEYQYVIIHCTKWNHWYGSAKLSPCTPKE